MRDAFISHASEDKDLVARPLANALRSAGLDIWYDEFSLSLGDSLRASIDRGLADSRYGVVVLSPNFFTKRWPREELNGLFAKELLGGKTILPIWHQITQAEVASHSPILADRLAALTANGLDSVVESVLGVVKPEASHAVKRGHTLSLSPTRIRLHTGAWAVKTQITVVNRGNIPLHSAHLRFALEGKDVASESIEIELDSLVPAIEERFGNHLVSSDQARLNCYNSVGERLVFFWIHTVPPYSHRTVTVTGTVPKTSFANVSISSFSEAVPEILKTANGFLVPFALPEAVTTTSMVQKFRPLAQS